MLKQNRQNLRMKAYAEKNHTAHAREAILEFAAVYKQTTPAILSRKT